MHDPTECMPGPAHQGGNGVRQGGREERGDFLLSEAGGRGGQRGADKLLLAGARGVTRSHVCSQQEWRCLPGQAPTARDLVISLLCVLEPDVAKQEHCISVRYAQVNKQHYEHWQRADSINGTATPGV
jgi:hypothetical protein